MLLVQFFWKSATAECTTQLSDGEWGEINCRSIKFWISQQNAKVGNAQLYRILHTVGRLWSGGCTSRSLPHLFPLCGYRDTSARYRSSVELVSTMPSVGSGPVSSSNRRVILGCNSRFILNSFHIIAVFLNSKFRFFSGKLIWTMTLESTDCKVLVATDSTMIWTRADRSVRCISKVKNGWNEKMKYLTEVQYLPFCIKSCLFYHCRYSNTGAKFR